MAERVSETTTIAAPVDTVLDVIIDLDAYPDWAEGMLEAETLSRDDQGRPVTARFRIDAKIAEVRYTLQYSYGDHQVSWTLVEGEMISQLDGRYELTPQGERTEVRYDLEADVDVPVPAFLKKRATKQILEQGLEGLKVRAESRS